MTTSSKEVTTRGCRVVVVAVCLLDKPHRWRSECFMRAVEETVA